MAVQGISVSLRGHYGDGRNVTAAQFLDPLQLARSEKIVEAVADRGKWKSALVVLSRRRVADYKDVAEPHEALAAAMQSDFEQAARWLEGHHAGIETMRREGLTVDLFLDLWIDEDQLELSYPSSLLLTCGRLGLRIEMVTND